MVRLVLSSPKGNQGVRSFPYQGYLGLTPLKVEGMVRTQLEQDGKPLLARDITVSARCYESRRSRLGVLHTNIIADFPVTLWKKPDHQDWAELGDSDHAFRITVPAAVKLPSTANYTQEYRVFWRLEATVNHIPMTGLGSRKQRSCELSFVRYDSPLLGSSPSPDTPLSILESNGRSKTLPMRYRVVVPSKPVGPLDIVPVHIHVHPFDLSVSIRSASATVERRIYFNDSSSSSSPLPPTQPLPISSSSFAPHSDSFSRSSSSHSPSAYVTQHSSSSPYQVRSSLHVPVDGSSSTSSSSATISYPPSSSTLHLDNDTRPLLPHSNRSTPTPPPATISSADRVLTHVFASTESRNRFNHDESGVWRQTLCFPWPDAKSSSRWVVGETLKTDFTTIKFIVRVKIVASSHTTSAESIELGEQEIFVLPTNEAQRQLALSKYSEFIDSTSALRSKSKSPRRSKRDRPTDIPPLSPHNPGGFGFNPLEYSNSDSSTTAGATGHGYKMSSASTPLPSSKSKTKSSRRPHTSAGPRDKPRTQYEPLDDRDSRVVVPLRPETAVPISSEGIGSTSRGVWQQKWLASPRNSNLAFNASPIGNGIGSAEHTEGSMLFEKVDQGEVRAWEEELARIEKASRMSSEDMMGLAIKRKRNEEQFASRTYLHAER